MTNIRIWIRGVHFAANPPCYASGLSEEEMQQRTVKLLEELDQKRPMVILLPEPDNVHDPHAIRAWCGGNPIGYVAAEETNRVHPLLEASHGMVEARIEEVEVKPRGNFRVKVDMPEKLWLKTIAPPEPDNAWSTWKCDVPDFPYPDDWKACRVMEYLIEKLLPEPQEADIPMLTEYIERWKDKSLHDLSLEARQQRDRYIRLLRATGDTRLKLLSNKLGKQITALCSDRRMKYRMQWWSSLCQSGQMEHYWDTWRSQCRQNNLWLDLQRVDTHLRRLPGALYANVGDLSVLFSTLHYRHDVPRSILWNIYSLLLLRERICSELGIPMKPLPLEAYGVEPYEPETPAAELTDERLARAVEECQPLFWAQSSWAVVFCVCRDYFGEPDNTAAFEKRVCALRFRKQVKECTAGTVRKTLANNSYMKMPVSKWQTGRALTLATQLKDSLENSFL